MKMVCLDVEGVLFPEVWQAIAAETGITSLELTTRDEPDYNKLMAGRITALNIEGIKFDDLIACATHVDPLPGAAEFLLRLRQRYQVSLVSVSYYEFLQPLGLKLTMPAIYCHNLIRAEDGTVQGWKPRLIDQKPKCVQAFQNLGFEIFAAGDSFNDIGMLDAANCSAFIHAPEHISALRPNIPACKDYKELEYFINQENWYRTH